MSSFFHMLTYDFIQRAFLVGIPVSLCAALLGVVLVLKRYSMIGDGLSHVSFSAMAVASAFGLAPLKTAVPVVIICAFLLLRMRGSGRLKGDSAIALLSSGALAIGVMAVSMSSGISGDLMNYMFGSILSVSYADAVFSVILSVLVIALFVLLYPRIFAVTFDETVSKATGMNVGLFNSALAVLIAVTVVIGMRMMGTLLISSLIIFPPVTAMCVCKKFRSVVLLSAVFAVVSFLAGMTISCVFGTPAGAGIVCVDIVLFAFVRLISK